MHVEATFRSRPFSFYTIIAIKGGGGRGTLIMECSMAAPPERGIFLGLEVHKMVGISSGEAKNKVGKTSFWYLKCFFFFFNIDQRINSPVSVIVLSELMNFPLRVSLSKEMPDRTRQRTDNYL